MGHNYYELTKLERLRYWLTDRRWRSPEERFFFEGCRDTPGQMYVADRKALYDTIVQHRPRTCFEIGTYTGGGSTFFLASAFAQLGQGKLITMEVDDALFHFAKASYQRFLPNLLPYVDFIQGSSPERFLPFIEENDQTVACFFLDGAEDAGETRRQYEFFEPYLKSGSIMIAHDWKTEKMRELAPVIERDPRWTINLEIGQPKSVGFVVCQYE